MSPENILRKGYAIIRSHNKIVNWATEIHEGEDIEILLKDAVLKSTVKEKIQYDGNHTDL